jgi:F-type H+-transporting ATPase subunit alpha
MAVRTEEISSILQQQIKGFDQVVATEEVGTVVQVGDGIARVWGLSNVGAMELVEFTEQGIMGIALNLEEDEIGRASCRERV